MTVRLSGPASDFVAANVGETGDYESASEYVRHLKRRDEARSEQEALDRPKAEPEHAFAAPDDSCRELPADEVIARSGARPGA